MFNQNRGRSALLGGLACLIGPSTIATGLLFRAEEYLGGAVMCVVTCGLIAAAAYTVYSDDADVQANRVAPALV